MKTCFQFVVFFPHGSNSLRVFHNSCSPRKNRGLWEGVCVQECTEEFESHLEDSEAERQLLPDHIFH